MECHETLIKTAKGFSGSEWKQDPTTAGMERERKNTHKRKGGRTRKHSFNIKFIMTLKCRSYFNVSNVKIKSFDICLFSSHHNFLTPSFTHLKRADVKRAVCALVLQYYFMQLKHFSLQIMFCLFPRNYFLFTSARTVKQLWFLHPSLNKQTKG